MEEPRSRAWESRDSWLVVGLVVFAVAMRSWQLTHTEVLSRDSIGFIRTSYEMEQYGWNTAIAGAEQHPAYPLAVLVVKTLGGSWLGDDLPRVWQLAAQLASALASTLLVLPVYFLSWRLFDRRVAVLSVLMVQCLPTLGQLLGDGLSEPLFLLGAMTTCCAITRAFDTRQPRWFLATAILGCLAYFVRPEGLVLVFSTFLVWMGLQFRRSSRQPWSLWLVQGSCLVVPTLVGVGIFVALTGKVTLKPSANRLMNELVQPEPSVWRDAPVGAGPILAEWWDGETHERSQRVIWAARVVGSLLIRATFHVGWVLGLLGLWWFRDRLSQPAVVVFGLTAGILVLLLYRVAWFLGYLSDRHLVLILLLYIPLIAAGLLELGRRIPWGQNWLPLLLVLAFLLPAAYRSLRTLHAERSGFRDAGEWLARNTYPGDYVHDPFSWTHYYAGRVFVERKGLLPSQPPVEYVVVERGVSKHDRLQRMVEENERRIRNGELLQTWQIRRGSLEVWSIPGTQTAANRKSG